MDIQLKITLLRSPWIIQTVPTTQVLSFLYLSLSSDAVLRPKLCMKSMKLVKLLVVKTKSYLLIRPGDFFYWCYSNVNLLMAPHMLQESKEDTVPLLLLQLLLSCLLELILKHAIFNFLWQTDFDSTAHCWAHKNTGMGDTDSAITLASRKDLNQTEIRYRPTEFNKVPVNCTYDFSHKNMPNKTP